MAISETILPLGNMKIITSRPLKSFISSTCFTPDDLSILAFMSYPRTLHPDFTISGAITEPIAPKPINPIFLIVISSPIFELYLYSTFRNKAFNLKF